MAYKESVHLKGNPSSIREPAVSQGLELTAPHPPAPPQRWLWPISVHAQLTRLLAKLAPPIIGLLSGMTQDHGLKNAKGQESLLKCPGASKGKYSLKHAKMNP